MHFAAKGGHAAVVAWLVQVCPSLVHWRAHDVKVGACIHSVFTVSTSHYNLHLGERVYVCAHRDKVRVSLLGKLHYNTIVTVLLNCWRGYR